MWLLRFYHLMTTAKRKLGPRSIYSEMKQCSLCGAAESQIKMSSQSIKGCFKWLTHTHRDTVSVAIWLFLVRLHATIMSTESHPDVPLGTCQGEKSYLEMLLRLAPPPQPRCCPHFDSSAPVIHQSQTKTIKPFDDTSGERRLARRNSAQPRPCLNSDPMSSTFELAGRHSIIRDTGRSELTVAPSFMRPAMRNQCIRLG